MDRRAVEQLIAEHGIETVKIGTPDMDGVYRGIRANSVAIQPKLRTMPRTTELRWVASHPGNASRKLNSAVRLSFGSAAYRPAAIVLATPRAMPRGEAPNVFKIAHTAAYSSHSFIGLRLYAALRSKYPTR